MLVACEKYPARNTRPTMLPVNLYVTGEDRDTSRAIRYAFSYNTRNYLTGRVKFEGGQVTERFTVNYDNRSLISSVTRETQGRTDTFFYSYDFPGLTLNVRRQSADRSSGMFRTYTYTAPPADREFLYPNSTLGRLESITDSIVENGQFARRFQRNYAYTMSNRELTDIVEERRESFPGAPNVSTRTGAYRTSIETYQNPFAYVSPDFFELPDELAQPWPFIRKGLVQSFRLSTPSPLPTELDTYEVAVSEPTFGTPRTIRKTMTGRRSGVIEVNYFIFEYQER
jgi:hypothetical protein